MKLLITILQHRRVVLPHLFLKHSLPGLIQQPGLSVFVHLVQHFLEVDIKSHHESSRLSKYKETLVKEWTAAGRYSPVLITRHDERFERYPSIPSRRIAAEFAATHTYDLHLWLEDDAFLYDPSCHTWPNRIGDNLVGTFSNNDFGYINSAYYVCKAEHDLALLATLREPSAWNLNSSMYSGDGENRRFNLLAPRIEPAITRLANGKIAHLNSQVVARYNNRKPESSFQRLRNMIARICPDDLHLLSIDFSDLSWP